MNQKVRVLADRQLVLDDRLLVYGEELELPWEEASALAKEGIVAIVLDPGVVVRKVEPAAEPAEPPKEVAVKSVFA